MLGVSKAFQARYVGEAAHRAFAARNVDMLIQYLYRDEPDAARWQSGLVTSGGSPKAARQAAVLPLAQVSRHGLRTVVWGQVRPEHGRQRYVLQQFRNGTWWAVGGVRQTTARGFLHRTIRAWKGSLLRLWYPRDHAASPALRVG